MGRVRVRHTGNKNVEWKVRGGDITIVIDKKDESWLFAAFILVITVMYDVSQYMCVNTLTVYLSIHSIHPANIYCYVFSPDKKCV